MDSRKNRYVWRELVDGVLLVRFVDRGDDTDPELTYKNDIAEFERLLGSLGAEPGRQHAVIDFANYRMTNCDNGRAIMCLVAAANKRLRARGGELSVCNHPAQFNPDLQDVFHFDKIIEIHRTQTEALDAARARLRDNGA